MFKNYETVVFETENGGLIYVDTINETPSSEDEDVLETILGSNSLPGTKVSPNENTWPIDNIMPKRSDDTLNTGKVFAARADESAMSLKQSKNKEDSKKLEQVLGLIAPVASGVANAINNMKEDERPTEYEISLKAAMTTGFSLQIVKLTSDAVFDIRLSWKK